MRRGPTHPAPDPVPGPLGATRARAGRARVSPLSREAAVLIGVAAIGLAWFLDPGPVPGPAPMRTARGDPRNHPIAFAVSADGTTIATACAEGRVVLRRLADGWDSPRTLDDRGLVLAIAFAPDGRSLALGRDGPEITVCDLGPGGAEHDSKIPIRGARALALSPDGRTLAASSGPTGEIILWDMAANRERARLRGHRSTVISLAFSPDGRTLASGPYGDRAIILWDPATGAGRSRLAATSGPITVAALAFSPDGSWLASASLFEGSVRIWDRAGRVVRRLDGRASGLNSVGFSADGRLLATTHHGGRVNLWDVATGRLLAGLVSHTEWLWGAAFLSDGRTLAAVASDDDLRLWDVTEVSGTRPDDPADR
jgi:WD40 repeat protein